MKKRTKTTISSEDVELFQQEVADVDRLHSDKVHHELPTPRPIPLQHQLDEEKVLQDMMSDHLDIADVETGEELVFSRPGISLQQMRKLRRGQFSVGGQLDLHGMTIDVARTALATFLRDSQISGIRCVRIIHGKGHGSKQKIPVLKNKVNRWLRQRDEVLAFSSAHPKDGGTGAVYVLIKNINSR